MRPTQLLGIALLLTPTLGRAQIFELYRPPPSSGTTTAPLPNTQPPTTPAPQVPVERGNVCSKDNTIATLERGLLDMTSQGQAQASAQLVRICLGEPGGVSFPLYFLAGTMGAAGTPTAREATASTLLNPLGGNLALAFMNNYTLVQVGQHTFLRLSVDANARYFHATDSTGASVPLAVGTLSTGLHLQTAAWSPEDPSGGVGTAWVQLAFAMDYASEAKLATIFGRGANDWTASLALDAGVKVAGRLDIKTSVYRVLNDRGITALKSLVLRAGMDFKTAQ